jgi:hypothetical protein
MHRDTYFQTVNDQNFQLAAGAAFEDFRDSLCNRTSENLSIPEYRWFIFGVSGLFYRTAWSFCSYYLIVS